MTIERSINNIFRIHVHLTIIFFLPFVSNLCRKS